MIAITDRLLALPKALASRYARQGSDEYDELVAAGNLALVRAAANCDPARANKPITYLHRCVLGQILVAAGRAKSSNARRWRRLVRFSEMDDGDERQDPAAPAEEYRGEDVAFAEAAARRWRALLTARQWQALWGRHGEGKSLREIAQAMGCSRERVRQICNEAVEKIRGGGGCSY